jgi:undecaprenyl-diphosphatase
MSRQQKVAIQRGSAVAFILTIAALLFAFGFIAQEVATGKTSAFDRQIMLALRTSADPSVPVGPAWLPEAARDLTSPGSIVVLLIITLVVGAICFWLASLR